ncbi:aromatic ring-hydroxylating oxygenase subunit alpha [Haloferula sargassicola]|uniref:Carnitine monooxygenase oxygenase subunit n=1 Tax=Haloferula sargassicola TaxID=490096 RepID=A0ABP9US79_9BACT
MSSESNPTLSAVKAGGWGGTTSAAVAGEEARVLRGCAENARLQEQARAGLRKAREVESLDALLAEVRRIAALPLEKSETLPKEVYTSDEFFAWEVDEVFSKEWFCVAHVSQIPENGDFINLDLSGDPLVVVRDKSGTVRVLSRACPHRGMDIMPPGFGHDGHGPAVRRESSPACGSTRLFLCPYHSWTFELDGRLKACPEMQQAEGFERDDWGLKEFRAEVWQGFVFVNLDGNAPSSVAEQYAELGEHVSKWNTAGMEIVVAREWDVPCNWKVLTENFMESYHHAGAHAKTLQTIMPAKHTWTEQERPHFIRCHLPYKAKVRDEIADAEAAGGHWEAFPAVEGLEGEDRFEWGLMLGYPLFTFVLTPDQLVWYRILPTGPDSLKLLTTVLVPKSTIGHPDFGKMLDRATAEAVAFHLEDMEVVAAVQRSLHASGYQRGRLSHLEMPIWLMQRYLAARARGTWPGLDHPPAPSQR